MKLRSGSKYSISREISIKDVIIVQSFVRGYIQWKKYIPILRAIKLLKKIAPHLYNYGHIKTKTKKTLKTKNNTTKKDEAPIDRDIRDTPINDLDEIINQYEKVKNLCRVSNKGIIKSNRINKGKNPLRYVDPDFKKIFMENNTLDDFMGSDSDDKESDDSGIDETELDDIEYSDEESNDYDSNQHESTSDYEDY